ncbi:MAG: hypothetical protein ACHQRL_09365, partial [Gemmatimonadales bacterium]
MIKSVSMAIVGMVLLACAADGVTNPSAGVLGCPLLEGGFAPYGCAKINGVVHGVGSGSPYTYVDVSAWPARPDELWWASDSPTALGESDYWLELVRKRAATSQPDTMTVSLVWSALTASGQYVRDSVFVLVTIVPAQSFVKPSTVDIT